ncbi:MAG: hypothetical protein ACOYEO_07540 [bacterium]|jgi:stage III sporulation protein AG
MFDEGRGLDKRKARGKNSWRWLNVDRQTLIKLGLLACLGVVLIVAGQLAKGTASVKTPENISPIDMSTAPAPIPEQTTSYQQLLEQQLAATLSQIQGVGQVLVQLSLEGGSQHSYATNSQEEVRIVEETAPSGTLRVSEEKRIDAQLVMAREGSSERPVVVDEKFPSVRGVLIVAKGAADPTTKEELSQAVQVLLGLPAHKVKVMEREG